jgi:hypothetical protein
VEAKEEEEKPEVEQEENDQQNIQISPKTSNQRV